MMEFSWWGTVHVDEFLMYSSFYSLGRVVLQWAFSEMFYLQYQVI